MSFEIFKLWVAKYFVMAKTSGSLKKDGDSFSAECNNGVKIFGHRYSNKLTVRSNGKQYMFPVV